MTEQPMLGLHLEPTIAIRRGEAYVVQCSACGLLAAIPSAHDRPPHQLGACPVCGHAGRWSQQHVPVGPFSAAWAADIVREATAVAEAEPDQLEAAACRLREALVRARSRTRETRPWLVQYR